MPYWVELMRNGRRGQVGDDICGNSLDTGWVLRNMIRPIAGRDVHAGILDFEIQRDGSTLTIPVTPQKFGDMVRIGAQIRGSKCASSSRTFSKRSS